MVAHGVMVTQQILVLLFRVRVLVGQQAIRTRVAPVSGAALVLVGEFKTKKVITAMRQ